MCFIKEKFYTLERHLLDFYVKNADCIGIKTIIILIPLYNFWYDLLRLVLTPTTH
jgi:hypothetical protein